MEDDDTEENRKTEEALTTQRETRRDKTQQQSLIRQESAEESDTMECDDSENEVDNIPKDSESDSGKALMKSDTNRTSSKESTDNEAVLSASPRNVSPRMLSPRDRRVTSVKQGTRVGMFVSNKSPQSSSSQEEYEPEVKVIPKSNFLTTGTSYVSARSMESLRTSRNFLSADDRYSEDKRSTESLSSSSETHGMKTHYRSFLTSSRQDVRRIVTAESRSSENLNREDSLNAEVRRGLFANMGMERKLPQHLSLPQPSHGVFSLTSPGGSDRRITILSPHSPVHSQEFSFLSLKNRRKKAIVLPRLVLPRSESEVFLE